MDKPRSSIFVCAAFKDNGNISVEIEACSIDEARAKFFDLHQIEPFSILGPYKKKKKIVNKDFSLEKTKIKAQYLTGSYKGWQVIAFPLLNDDNKYYLLFSKPILKTSFKPSGNIVVDKSEVIFSS